MIYLLNILHSPCGKNVCRQYFELQNPKHILPMGPQRLIKTHLMGHQGHRGYIVSRQTYLLFRQCIWVPKLIYQIIILSHTRLPCHYNIFVPYKTSLPIETHTDWNTRWLKHTMIETHNDWNTRLTAYFTSKQINIEILGRTTVSSVITVTIIINIPEKLWRWGVHS